MFIRIIIIYLGLCGLLKAQNNLIIVDGNGGQFWLFIDGHKINDSPQSIVKATHLLKDTIPLKITFFDKKINDITAGIYFLQKGKSCHNLEFTYAIEPLKDKNELKFISTNLLLTDTILQQKHASEKVRNFLALQQKEKENKNRLTEKYPAPEKCLFIIGDSLLERQIKYLQNNHIELNRVKDAKWFISNNCLNVSQTEKILSVFDYEDSKEKLAEFGYDYLIDKENLLNLLTSLKYKTEKEELKKFYAKKTIK